MAPTTCPRFTSHSLDEITGYAVVRTISADGTLLGDQAQVIAVTERANSYLAALDIAKAHRVGVGGEYAVVRDLHGCAYCDPIVLAGRQPSVERMRAAGAVA